MKLHQKQLINFLCSIFVIFSSLNVQAGIILGGGTSPAIIASHLGSETVVVGSAYSRLGTSADFICDGTDDQVEINQAIDIAAALPYGGKVLVLEGVYQVNSSITPKSNVWLCGQGMGKTIFYGTTSLGNTGVMQYFPAAGSGKFILTDFTINGSGMNHTGYDVSRKGINMVPTDYSLVRHVYVYDTPATGIAVDHSRNLIIDGAIVESCGTEGEYGSNGIGQGSSLTADQGVDMPEIVTNCILKNNANAGILFEAQSGSQQNDSWIVTNNLCYGNKDGIRFSGTGQAVISNNQCWDNTEDGIDIEAFTFVTIPGHELIINGNSVHDNGDSGIKVDSESANNIIITSNIAKGNLYGINSKSSSTIISNNITDLNINEGILCNVSENASVIKINDNIVTDNGIGGTVGSNDGIHIVVASGKTLTNLSISNNQATDTRPSSKTQRYGIRIDNSGTVTFMTMVYNILQGNASGSATMAGITDTDYYIFGNQGYLSNSPIKMKSADGTSFGCGPDNSGNFVCSAL